MYLTLAEAGKKLAFTHRQLLLYVNAGLLKPHLCIQKQGFVLVKIPEDKAGLLLSDFSNDNLTLVEMNYLTHYREDFEVEASDEWLFKEQDCDRSILDLRDKPPRSRLEERAIVILKAMSLLNYNPQCVEHKGKVEQMCQQIAPELFVSRTIGGSKEKFKGAWRYGNKKGYWAIKPEKRSH